MTYTFEGPRPVIAVEREFPDPPEKIWRSLTEPDGLAGWFPCSIEGAWEVGATLTFRFPPEVIDLTMEGAVLAVDPGRRLSYTWGEETLTFELTGLPNGGTRLVVRDELPAPFAARNAAGWEECLERLAGGDPPDGSWRGRFDRYMATFEPGLGPQEGPPQGHPEA